MVSKSSPSTRFLAYALTGWGAFGELMRAVPASCFKPGIFLTPPSSWASPSRTRPGSVWGLGDRDRSRRTRCCCCCRAENEAEFAASESPELSSGMSTRLSWKNGNGRFEDEAGSSFFGVRTAEMSVWEEKGRNPFDYKLSLWFKTQFPKRNFHVTWLDNFK